MKNLSLKDIAEKFKILKRIVGRLDWFQIVPAFVLIAFGVVFIYGTGQQVGGTVAEAFWKKQIIWISAGVGIWAFLTFFDYRNLKLFSPFIYIISMVLLVLVLFAGIKIYGARRWLQLPGIRFQPSELAKLAVLLLISTFISMRHFNINSFKGIFIIVATAFVPFMLILMEPDLGSALIIPPIVAFILFISKLKIKYIVGGIVAGIVFFSVEVFNEAYQVYPLLKKYQVERILVFLDPERDPENRGWNQLQSELAVGSGGLTGKGFMQGTQNTLGFLPQTVSNTDFIFSVIAEETGFIGAVSIILCYILLFFSALRTSVYARDRFGKYVAAGIAAIIFSHSIVNIGMSIRMMPVTGLPLPLVSYGGSFMVSSMLYLGILQSIYAHRRRSLTGTGI